MITKITLEDELGKINQYDIDLDLEPTKKITLRKVGNIEIILKHEDKNSDLYIQFEDLGVSFTSIIKRYEDLYPNSRIPILKKASVLDYAHEEFIMYKKSNLINALTEVHKLFLSHALPREKYELSKINMCVDRLCAVDRSLEGKVVFHSNVNFLDFFQYLAFLVDSNRYELIKNSLDMSLEKTIEYKIYENLNEFLPSLEYPELNKGITLYFKFKGKKAYEKSEKLLRNLFFLGKKEYSLDASIEKIKAAWSG